MRSRADCSSYHAGAWALRVVAWRIFSAAASLLALAPPADAQIVAAVAPGQLPPVTVTSPETARQQRIKPPRRQAGSARNAAIVQANPAVTPAANGVTSGSASGPANLQPAAASEIRFTGQEFNARPASRVGELLEIVPGLIVTQHSGEGKANQYFLRGFNLDHGTDLAITVDGMPVNMPTHGHGQGYADINFLIPELVQSVNVRKGPYFADKGDFASAGTVDIDYVTKLPKNLAEMTLGSFGYQRALAAGSTAVGDGTLLAAFEANKYNGPWDVPDNVRKLNGVLRYSQGTATDGFTLSAMAYSNGWNSTDQVAQRAIDQGVIGRFGSLDPTDGGISSRFSLSSNWAQSSEYGQSKVSAYVIRSSLNAVQQFHLLPRRSRQWRPVQPDSTAARSMGSMPATPSTCVSAGIETQTRVGLQTRGDDIHVGLFKTLQRETLSTVRDDSVKEGNVGLWADTTARWTDWLRTTVGIREDYFAGRVVSDTPAKFRQCAGVDDESEGRHCVRSLVQDRILRQCRLRPALQRYQRGATITVDPNDKVTPLDRVPLLVRSKGAEIGVRTKAIEGLDQFACAVRARFRLRIAVRRRRRHHRAEPAQPSRRRRMDQPVQGQCRGSTLDLDLAYTRARFTNFDLAGDRIPGAPAWIASGG